MDEENRKRIQGNYVILCQDMSALDLMPYLFEDGAITINDKETIEGKLTTHQKNQTLLDVILRKGNHGYNTLYKALVMTKQHHLAEKLLPPATNCQLVRNPGGELGAEGDITPTDMDVTDLSATGERTPMCTSHSSLNVNIIVVGCKCGPNHVIACERENVVDKVKEYVRQMFGIDNVDQLLTMNNMPLCQSASSIVSQCVRIKQTNTVHVTPHFLFSNENGFNVQIGINDKDGFQTISIFVSENDNIRTLKAKMKLEYSRNIPYYQFCLMVDGQECLEGTTVQEYGITEESVIRCQIRPDYFPLRIRDSIGTLNFTIPVTGAMKIETLQEQIFLAQNVSRKMYQLLYKNVKVEDHKTIMEIDELCKLKESEITLKMMMPGLFNVSHSQYFELKSSDHYVAWNDSMAVEE